MRLAPSISFPALLGLALLCSLPARAITYATAQIAVPT